MEERGWLRILTLVRLPTSCRLHAPARLAPLYRGSLETPDIVTAPRASKMPALTRHRHRHRQGHHHYHRFFGAMMQQKQFNAGWSPEESPRTPSWVVLEHARAV